MEKHFEYFALFEEFLFSEIKRIWLMQRPNDFIVCNAIGEEYKNCNHASYSWYMRIINSDIPSNVSEKLSDAAKYKDKDGTIQKRKDLYKSLIECDNIVMWCVENIDVSKKQ